MKVELTAEQIEYIRDVMGAMDSPMAQHVASELYKYQITFTIGDRFELTLNGNKMFCMLAACKPNVVNMISLDDGSYIGNPTYVKSTRRITRQEFCSIVDNRPEEYRKTCDIDQTERLQLTVDKHLEL